MHPFLLTGPGGYYIYTKDLWKLEAHVHRGGSSDSRLAKLATPLDLPIWEAKLAKHPDSDYAQYILNGIKHGFQIGVNEYASFRSAKKNMESARQNPHVIEDYINQQVADGNIIGPFPKEKAPAVHINRLGAIPKKHQPGKWRVITDLSFPNGASIR